MAISLKDIVRFGPDAKCETAVWCRARGITGVVTGMDRGVAEIDVGLYYKVYANPEHLEYIADPREAPIPEGI